MNTKTNTIQTQEVITMMSKQTKNRKKVIVNCRQTYNSLTQLIKTVTNYDVKEDL
ncbi:MAG: hypothetical protein FWG55_02875 [Candidatus Bathyarchaeota archaeon]|nr:hypothetical protein [Candidatus Termiticorpusculum sp.]